MRTARVGVILCLFAILTAAVLAQEDTKEPPKIKSCQKDNDCTVEEFCDFSTNLCKRTLREGEACSRKRQCKKNFQCEHGKCVECTMHKHCEGEERYCDLEARKCRTKAINGLECDGDYACRSGNCHEHKCVECKDHTDCPDIVAGTNTIRRFCDPELHQCRGKQPDAAKCRSNNECSSGRCEKDVCKCTSVSCPEGTKCDRTRGICLTPAQTNKDEL